METSMRLSGSGVSKSLRIHAKQKFYLPFHPLSFFQVHGELDTKFGVPSYFSAILGHSFPKWSASVGLGVQYNNLEKLQYTVCGKKAFPVTSNGLLSFNIKGRCDASEDFKERKCNGAAEFLWSITNFQKDQDVRFKVGYDIIDKVPYMQIRENNWSVNADANRRWSIRYDM